RFAFTPVRPGRYRIEASAAERARVSIPVDAGRKDVEITVASAGRIRGRVDLAGGSMPYDLALRARRPRSDLGSIATFLVAPDGSFRLDGLEPGEFVFFTSRAGVEGPHRRVDLPPGGTVDDVVVELPPLGRTISGRVLHTGGRPVPSGTLVIVAASEPPAAQGHTVLTGADGRFE